MSLWLAIRFSKASLTTLAIRHSFTSLMNYADDDYVMGHILRFARSPGRDTLTLDFARREAGPPELLAPPISEVPARYTEWFWDLVQRHGSDRSLVQSATLTLRYDIATKRPLRSAPQFIECALQIFAARSTWPTLTGGGIQSALGISKGTRAPAGSSGLHAST